MNALFVDWKENRLKCLVRFKGEWGLLGGVGLGPTIQTSNTVEKNENETLVYNVLKKKKGEVLFDVLQSEEGVDFFARKIGIL